MGYQDDYVMRTISDLVRAIARLALGKNEIKLCPSGYRG